MRESSPKTLIIHISLCFFFLFAAYSSFMTIVIHIYQQQNLHSLGPISLMANYIAFIISTILAPACKIRYKYQMLFGAIAYTLNYSMGIFIPIVPYAWKYVLAITGTVVAGSSAGYLWVSQGKYMHLVCTQYGITSEKGKYFSIFTSMYCFTNVAAGLITTFGFALFSTEIYFVVLTTLGILSTLLFLTLKDIQQPQAHEQPQKALLSESTQITVQNDTANLFLFLKQKMKATLHFYSVMFAVLPLLLIDGFCLGFYSAEITHLIPAGIVGNQRNLFAGLCTITLGIGSMIGGLLSGLLSDRLSSKVTAKIGLFLFVFACLSVELALQLARIQLALTSAFLWGLALFFIEGLMYIVCSQYYKGHQEAFAINKQFHSVIYLIFQIAVIFTGNDMPLAIIVGISAFLALPATHYISKLGKVTS